MSEFNEELLNDVDDYQDLGEADEDALLQDDEDGEGDVLELVPEVELGESLDDSRVHHSEVDEETEETRHEKFAVERTQITAPEPSVEEPRQNYRFQRGNNRGSQRGRGGRGRFQNNGRGRFVMGNQSGRNKTVLINPRFQGVVHVNNNARLAWDTSQQQPYQPNPWASGNPPNQMAMGRPMQPIRGPMPAPPMQAVQQGPPMHQQQMHGYHPPQHMQMNYQGPPMQPIHQEQLPMQQGPMQPIQNMGPPGQHMQYIPPPQQSYMPQPLPPGVQQPAMQGPNQQMNPFMQNNFQSSPPVIMNSNQPPPPQGVTPNFQMYNQQGDMSPMPPPNFNQHLNFVPPPNRQVFPRNNNPNNMQYNQGNNMSRNNRRELFTQKRKVMTPGTQNKKIFIQDRLGGAHQPLKQERPSVVKEVTVTNVTTVKIEEDEATKDLRMKIEEQKRKREAILQWKERRRLEMLKQRQEGNMSAADQKPLTQTPQFNQQSPVNIEKNEPRSSQIPTPGLPQVVQTVTTYTSNRPVKLRKQSNNIVITSGYSRKYTKFQKKKTDDANRVVLPVPTAPTPMPVPVPVPEPELKLDKKHLSSFLADRKILTKDDSLMSTRKVVIKNISTSTGDKKIFQISKNIGEVQKLHRDKNERQATITFKSVASAHAFFKKYQRHMLDLSMIEVSLCPMSESDE